MDALKWQKQEYLLFLSGECVLNHSSKLKKCNVFFAFCRNAPQETKSALPESIEGKRTLYQERVTEGGPLRSLDR